MAPETLVFWSLKWPLPVAEENELEAILWGPQCTDNRVLITGMTMEL